MDVDSWHISMMYHAAGLGGRAVIGAMCDVWPRKGRQHLLSDHGKEGYSCKIFILHWN